MPNSYPAVSRNRPFTTPFFSIVEHFEYYPGGNDSHLERISEILGSDIIIAFPGLKLNHLKLGIAIKGAHVHCH